jgi:hypothetical protein
VTFDPRTYLRDVINPLRDQVGGLPPDLAPQYGVEPGMDGRQIAEQLRRVRSFWQQRQGGSGGAAIVCAQMLTRDERLRAEHGDRMAEPGWWLERAAQSERQAAAEGQRLADDLRNAYGALGLITKERLDAIVRHYPGLNQSAVDDAVRGAGLSVVDPVDLPQHSGLDASAFRTLSNVLGRVGAPTIVQLLHPDAAPFRLLGPGGPALDLAIVTARREAANTVADSSGARLHKQALGLLGTALADGADLRQLALFQIVELLRVARRQAGLPDSSLVRKATDAGLELTEAQTVVLSLPEEEPVDPAQRIRDLIEEGRLHAAEQAVAALPEAHPDRAELQQRVSEQAAEVDDLRRRSDLALRDGHEEEAETMLRAAWRIAGDDDDLERRLAALPPAPVRDLVARAKDDGVALSWTPPPAAGELRYRVVCGDTPPRSPGDGDVVGEGDRPETVDRVAEPGRTRHYAVFVAAGGASSRPATTEITVVPPVSAVKVRVEAGEVFCSWHVHPHAEGVRVRRAVGRRPSAEDDGELVPSSRDGLYDRAGDDGDDRFYTIVALYRNGSGAEVTAPMVVTRATARVEAPPYVQRLRVHLTALDDEHATANIAWPTPSSGRVSVRRSARPPSWPPGSTVSAADVESFGEPLVGDRLVQGPETQIAVTVPNGQQVYVPFTFDRAGTAVVGEPASVGMAEKVRELLARRVGSEVILSWIWPPGVNLAEVTFTPDRGAVHRRRTTRGEVAERGCRIPIDSSGGQITVCSVVRAAGGDLLSAPAKAGVDGVATVLEYHLLRVGGVLSRGRRLLRVTVDRPCRDVELHLVVSTGLAMPSRPESGTTLQRFTGLRLDPDTPWEVPFTVTRHNRPYWLRCFVVQPQGIRVVDPITEMKVA